MKALSLWQPWAGLVACGVKTVETRSWSTRYRGPLAIHAAKRKPTVDEAMLLAKAGACLMGDVPAVYSKTHPLIPFGVVVATCELAACIPTEGIIWCPAGGLSGGRHWGSGDNCAAVIDDERPYGDYSPGRWAWLLNDIKPVEIPIPVTGHQGLWNWEPADLLDAKAR